MTNKILVKDAKGNKRIVQASMVPEGFIYVEDYKVPSKAPVKAKAKPTPKKSAKKEQPKKEAKK